MTSRASNMFFEGGRIFNYGHHCCTGRILYKRRRADVVNILKMVTQLGLKPGQALTEDDLINLWRTGGTNDTLPSIAVVEWALANKDNLEPPSLPGTHFNMMRDGWNEPIRMRLDSSGVVTTRGAHFPLSHAKRAYDLWARLQGKVPPEGWKRSGDSSEGIVGHFKIDRIEANGDIHAGCHHILAAEVAGFAKFMGWAS